MIYYYLGLLHICKSFKNQENYSYEIYDPITH